MLAPCFCACGLVNEVFRKLNKRSRCFDWTTEFPPKITFTLVNIAASLRKYQADEARYNADSFVCPFKQDAVVSFGGKQVSPDPILVYMCMYKPAFSATSFVQQHTVFLAVCFRASFLARRPPCDVVSAKPLSPFLHAACPCRILASVLRPLSRCCPCRSSSICC